MLDRRRRCRRRAEDFLDDGEETNAELRQRGATARLSEQKSYRVELKGKGVRWRGEDRLQLSKHPYDPSKIWNKLAFDPMAEIPNPPSMRTRFVDLWIDDGEGPVPYGLFTRVEAAVEEYLENRGWDEDDRLYKAEKFVFTDEDLAVMALDEDGEPLERFPSGTLYARLVARVDRDPSRFWKISSNRADIDGERRVGIREFRVP